MPTRAATSVLLHSSIKDAKKRIVQSPDVIPEIEAGRAALAAGGEAAKKVEIPGVATTASPSSEEKFGRFFETQSSRRALHRHAPGWH